MSGDYKCSPLKFDGRRKNTELTVINRSHPIYTNYSGMLTRANTDDVSESDIYIDPAWVGFHHPSHVTLMDKYGFCSYAMWMCAALGTKPNHTHSSSSNFHVDRYNNCLHYTIDNVRWTDSGTNYKNKEIQYANATTSMESILTAIKQQSRITRRMIARKFKH
jgi:hypothetical protein